MKIQRSGRSTDIDGFRAISIMLVVLAHLGISASPGQTGVLFFFVISGYVITKSILSEFNKTNSFSVKKFYQRRFYKIIPPLFFIVIVPSIVLYKSINLDISHLISQIFFYYNWVKIGNGTNGLLPGTSVVWSLSIEEQFYIAIAIVIGILIKCNRPKFPIHLFLIYLSIFIYSAIKRIYLFSQIPSQDRNADSTRILLGTDTRMSSIAIGGLIALLVNWKRPKFQNYVLPKNVKIIYFITATMLALFSVFYREIYFRNTYKYTLQEIVCAMVILAAINPVNLPLTFRRILNLRIVQLIGVASYSIYLSHLSIIYLLQNSPLPSSTTNWRYLIDLVLVIIVLVSGIILHYIFDKPFEAKRNSYRQPIELHKSDS